jgi:hypothetical protein
MRGTKPLSVVGRLFLGDSPAGRAAAMLSTVTAGVSFTPGLMPRSRRDQVLLTGVAAALQHGLMMNAHARHQVIANLVCAWTGHPDDTAGRQRVEAAVAAGTTAVGLAAYFSLPYRPHEPFGRVLATATTAAGPRWSASSRRPPGCSAERPWPPGSSVVSGGPTPSSRASTQRRSTR